MRNSAIKPYRETKCLDCLAMEQPDDSIKITTSDRCILGPHFHHQKHQKAKYQEKQVNKPKKNAKPKVAKVRDTNMAHRSHSSLLLLTQNSFNTFIRNRDSKGDHFICISCNEPKPLEQMNAGHYYSAGNHSYLRFNENNVHGQCIKCNCFLHGNLLPYRENLLKKIGPVELEKLDTWKNFSHKWDKLQLIALIKLYAKAFRK
jgi:hypothetical protein